MGAFETLYMSLHRFFVYSSPAGSPAPVESCRIPLSQFVRNSALRHNNAISAPSTPELHIRRQYTQSFRYAEKFLYIIKQTQSAEFKVLRLIRKTMPEHLALNLVITGRKTE